MFQIDRQQEIVVRAQLKLPLFRDRQDHVGISLTGSYVLQFPAYPAFLADGVFHQKRDIGQG